LWLSSLGSTPTRFQSEMPRITAASNAASDSTNHCSVEQNLMAIAHAALLKRLWRNRLDRRWVASKLLEGLKP
jgi:hypothetical protein